MKIQGEVSKDEELYWRETSDEKVGEQGNTGD